MANKFSFNQLINNQLIVTAPAHARLHSQLFTMLYLGFISEISQLTYTDIKLATGSNKKGFSLQCKSEHLSGKKNY